MNVIQTYSDIFAVINLSLRGLEIVGRYKPLMDGPRGHNNNKYVLIISTVREPWGLWVSLSNEKKENAEMYHLLLNYFFIYTHKYICIYIVHTHTYTHIVYYIVHIHIYMKKKSVVCRYSFSFQCIFQNEKNKSVVSRFQTWKKNQWNVSLRRIYFHSVLSELQDFFFLFSPTEFPIPNMKNISLKWKFCSMFYKEFF